MTPPEAEEGSGREREGSLMNNVEYTVQTAIEQIEKCSFQCEGGPLENNTGYRWLKEQILTGPTYRLGQWVYFLVEGEVNKIKLSQWTRLCVVAVVLGSDDRGSTWHYSLSADPPSAYHYGSGHQFTNISQEKIWPRNPAESDAGVSRLERRTDPPKSESHNHSEGED
jgi:hypothetical protein